ncbi:unnamed protein product [Lupinus luteus]|uniref:Auxin-induced protein n=1 Tax=Lupinus luteus TaxID=3873 RepID=A0AAV1XGS5_LUPLU
MRKATTSNSSSSINSSNNNPFISTASSLTHVNSDELHTDLRLGLSIPITQHVGSSMSRRNRQQLQPLQSGSTQSAEVNDESFFVKVYMEGIPIGRKLNLLAHNGYLEMFLSTVKRLKITRVDAFRC